MSITARCFYTDHGFTRWNRWYQQSKKHTCPCPSLRVTCMLMVWLYTGMLSCPVSPGTWTLHPTPYRGLIWGEGWCVLLLVTSNHSRPITFTACHAILVMLWTLRRHNSCVCCQMSSIGDNEGPESYKLTRVALVRFIPNRLKQIATYLEGSSWPPLPSCPLSWPTRPLSVLFGHWRLSVGVYVQFTGAERSQFHVLL